MIVGGVHRRLLRRRAADLGDHRREVHLRDCDAPAAAAGPEAAAAAGVSEASAAT